MDGLLHKHFARIGARARVIDRPGLVRMRWTAPADIRLDVRTDREGEFFEITRDPRAVRVEVIDARPRARHLLLLARTGPAGRKEKFLCGHDERHWFVAAVPGRSVASVETAMEALKPVPVRQRQDRVGVRRKRRHRRRNEAFIRQGEWFFLPEPNLPVDRHRVLRGEPLRRGGGKAHVCEYLVRDGGMQVYVTDAYPNGLTPDAYRALRKRSPAARRWFWRIMVRDAGVFVRGRIRHDDHQTVVLDGWHRVLMNRETEAPAMRHVAFLD